MIAAEVRMDLRAFEASLTDAERKQLPYALSLALNDTVRGGRIAVQAEMDKVFDRPTPYAKRGVVYDRATRREPIASVVLTGDRTRGGLPATAFLGPQVQGGLRSLKAFERQLVDRNFMKADEVAVPADRAPLNRYGNMTQGFLNRVMADLKVDYRGAGATRARTDRSLKRNANYRRARFFVPRRAGHLFPGVYQRKPGGAEVFPMILFVRQRPYGKKLDFFRVVSEHAGEHFGRHFAEAFAKAMRTAR